MIKHTHTTAKIRIGAELVDMPVETIEVEAPVDKLHPFHEITATGQNWELFRSKKALRDALADAPGFIVWRAISGPQDGFRDRYLTTAELVEAINESAVLVGPHPETNRKYFGTVTVKAGKIQVK